MLTLKSARYADSFVSRTESPEDDGLLGHGATSLVAKVRNLDIAQARPGGEQSEQSLVLPRHWLPMLVAIGAAS